MSSDLMDISRKFATVCENEDLHGLAFQHYVICHRRAWFHINRIDYFHLEERMAKGKTLHDNSKQRDKSVTGLMGMAPDRIDWENKIVYEAKGGAGAKKAVGAQTAYYAAMLMNATGDEWQAANDIIPEKRKRPVEINADVVSFLLETADKLKDLKTQKKPPAAKKKAICATCSYRFLCGYE